MFRSVEDRILFVLSRRNLQVSVVFNSCEVCFSLLICITAFVNDWILLLAAMADSDLSELSSVWNLIAVSISIADLASVVGGSLDCSFFGFV